MPTIENTEKVCSATRARMDRRHVCRSCAKFSPSPFQIQTRDVGERLPCGVQASKAITMCPIPPDEFRGPACVALRGEHFADVLADHQFTPLGRLTAHRV